MAPKLYMVGASPAVRSVLLTAKAVGLTLELIPMDLSKKDQLKPEFIKLNPQHTVPTLDDDGKIVWDSHAINAYLAAKYGKDDSLYPKDAYKQAVVNQRLHFDSSVFFPSARQIIRPIIHEGAKSVPPEKVPAVIQSYDFLEKFLEGRQWAAGDSVTIADFSLITSTTSIAVLVPIDEIQFPNINAWIKRVQDLPYYEVERTGLAAFEERLRSRLSS